MRRGNVPSGPLTSVISMQATVYTIYRPTDTATGSANDGEWAGERTQNYVTDHDAPIDAFEPQSQPRQYPTGTDVEASLQGLCLPTADIEERDVIVHANGQFEVTAKDGWPNDTDPQFYQLRFEERPDYDLP